MNLRRHETVLHVAAKVEKSYKVNSLLHTASFPLTDLVQVQDNEEDRAKCFSKGGLKYSTPQKVD